METQHSGNLNYIFIIRRFEAFKATTCHEAFSVNQPEVLVAESLQNTIYQFHLHVADCSKRLKSYLLFNNNVFHLLILHKFILSCTNYGSTGTSYDMVLLPTLIHT